VPGCAHREEVVCQCCPTQRECSKTACADSIDTGLADATRAVAQGCALACARSGQQCALNCASQSRSPLAFPVATCMNSNCASLSTIAEVDCLIWQECLHRWWLPQLQRSGLQMTSRKPKPWTTRLSVTRATSVASRRWD